LKPENESPNSSNQSRQDYSSDSSDPYADCDERPKTTNRQQESSNPSLNQENGETLSKNEATNPSNTSEESSESCADGNEEKPPANGKKKLRKTKQQQLDKRKKKSDQIPSMTDQEMQNPTSKTPEDCDDENEWITAGNKKNKNKNHLKPIVDLRDSKHSSKYNIHFHVFVPPEFNIDSIEYEFGLITSLNNFDPKQMHPFQSKPLDTGGFLVTGTLSLQNTKRNFEYKYVLRIKEDDTHIIEFLGKKYSGNPVNRNFRKNDSSVDNQQYDGIMLPPDQETETSNVSKYWKKFTRKIFGGKYYDKEMLKKYEDKTIRVMLKQVIDLKTLDTVESCKSCLQKVENGLNELFKESSGILKVN